LKSINILCHSIRYHWLHSPFSQHRISFLLLIRITVIMLIATFHILYICSICIYTGAKWEPSHWGLRVDIGLRFHGGQWPMANRTGSLSCWPSMKFPDNCKYNCRVGFQTVLILIRLTHEIGFQLWLHEFQQLCDVAKNKQCSSYIKLRILGTLIKLCYFSWKIRCPDISTEI